MRASVLVGFLFCLVFACSLAVSQQAASVGGVHTRIAGIEIPTVANAPFTAKVLVNWNKPLVGGGTVSRKYYTQVARDSQGRVRREIRGFIPADSNEEPPLRTFTIIDPVSGTRTTCTKATMNCATSSFQPPLDLSSDAGESPGTNSNVTRQNLGQQTMLNLSVVGTRETVVGSGTARLALMHTDVWYSPDLQMDLSVIRESPQLGEVTLEVTDLVRGDPDSSWLAIPSGYRVIGARSQ